MTFFLVNSGGRESERGSSANLGEAAGNSRKANKEGLDVKVVG